MPKQVDRTIEYAILFPNQERLIFSLDFDEKMNLIYDEKQISPDWTLLSNQKCQSCTLSDDENKYCPVAFNLHQVVEKTMSKVSHEKCEALVSTPERDIYKETRIQTVLFSLFGLIMSTCGCPVLEWFRPLARFHLPFSSIEETEFRALSLNFLYLFFSAPPAKELSLDLIVKQYKLADSVNRDFLTRIRSFTREDSEQNAVVSLNLFAQMFELSYENEFKRLSHLFGPGNE